MYEPTQRLLKTLSSNLNIKTNHTVYITYILLNIIFDVYSRILTLANEEINNNFE